MTGHRSTEPEFLTGREFVEFAGVSPRQMQCWDEAGYLVAKRVDGKRRFTRNDAIKASVLLQLRAKGLQLKRLRKALELLDERKDCGVGMFLCVGPRTAALATRSAALRWACAQPGGVLAVEVKELW